MKWTMVQWCMDCCTVVQEFNDVEECNCGEEE